MISIEDFRTRFPEFSDVTSYPDARVQLFIDDSIQDIGSDESRWAGKYNRAQSYYVAHLLHKASLLEAGSTSSTTGPISSKTAGGVSVSRSVVAKKRSDTDDALMSTYYGQTFMSIRNSVFASILTV